MTGIGDLFQVTRALLPSPTLRSGHRVSRGRVSVFQAMVESMRILTTSMNVGPYEWRKEYYEEVRIENV